MRRWIQITLLYLFSRIVGPHATNHNDLENLTGNFFLCYENFSFFPYFVLHFPTPLSDSPLLIHLPSPFYLSTTSKQLGYCWQSLLLEKKNKSQYWYHKTDTLIRPPESRSWYYLELLILLSLPNILADITLYLWHWRSFCVSQLIFLSSFMTALSSFVSYLILSLNVVMIFHFPVSSSWYYHVFEVITSLPVFRSYYYPVFVILLHIADYHSKYYT